MAVGSLIAWILILRGVDAREITDVGLISVVPPGSLLLVAALSATFALALRMRPVPSGLVVLQLVCLVVMLYGAPSLFEEMPRFVTAWRHLGFVDVIERTGELYPNRDARFDWPAFFILAAFVKAVVQPNDFLSMLAWVPVASMLLYLGPLFVIVRAATSDMRVVWLALWLFCLTNWVGQDYFSPQGFNLLLFLTVLAVLIAAFRQPVAKSWVDRLLDHLRMRLWQAAAPLTVDAEAESARRGSHPTRREQIGLVAIIGLLFGASVASHQLTPFALVGAVTVLVVADRVRLRGLPVVMIVLLGAWLTFMATTYLSGHLSGLVDEVGRPGEIAATNVAGRIVGSPGHLLVLQLRLGFTVAVWLLAALGAVRRLAAGRLDLTLGLLAAAPFGLILLQGYGGEMLLRVYLFSLPFVAFFAAGAFFPTPRPASRLLTLVIVVVSIVLSVGLITTRYGNEKADLVTREDYLAMEALAEQAVANDWILLLSNGVPVEYRDFGKFRYRNVGYLFRGDGLDGLLAALPRATPHGESVYFLVTRGQKSHAELFWGMSGDDWDERVEALTRQVEVVYRNREAAVLRWRNPER